MDPAVFKEHEIILKVICISCKMGYIKLNVVHTEYTLQLSVSFQNSKQMIQISLLGCGAVCYGK
jgi:hypothetical protein